MNHVQFRMIDANINRISEGIRVLEDIARFGHVPESICKDLRIFRHTVRKNMTGYRNECLNHRDSDHDPGFMNSQHTDLDSKHTKEDLILANFKRVQEGLRVVEEVLKTMDLSPESKTYERLRYQSYLLEKNFPVSSFTRPVFPETDLYCLTAESLSKGKDNLTIIKEMIRSDIRIIQYREKTKNMKDKYRECMEIRNLTRKAGVTFIINDHIDLAILADADGVHIGQDDLPPEEVRTLVGDKMLIGISTHSPRQAEDAVKKGADYIGAGPVFKTETKTDVCEPVGLSYLDYVVNNIPVPVVAIGGIKTSNIHDVRKTGITCSAMVSEIVGSENISKTISSLRSIIHQKDLKNHV